MQVEVFRKVPVNIDTIKMELAVRYDEEDIPREFPGRVGDLLTLVVKIDTGEIVGWPQGRVETVYMKVCDCGTYTLYDGDRIVASLEQEYVPHGVVPGDYGDYVDLCIDETGRIINWPTPVDVTAFFEE